MTSNQIAYWNLKETERANRAKEDENVRHNRADEYNKLINSLNNPFSLGAHFAQGSNELGTGLKNQISSVWKGITGPKTIGGNLLYGKKKI